MLACSRREAIRSLAAPFLASSLPFPAAGGRQRITFGYASITWGGDDRAAIRDVSAVGFRGIQLRSGAVQVFGDRPSELKDLLAAHSLTFVALSSGNVGIESARDDELARHVEHAKFLRACGGLYLQVIDDRPKRDVRAADYAAMGRRLTDLGKRTADLGIPLGYHHHMGSLGEAPGEVDRILDASDPRYVRLQLDTAHYQQGGGDPASAVRKYASRLLFLHLKDVRPREPGNTTASSYQFVELGRGRVDFKAVFRALADVAYAGWVVVELDAVPDGGGTPRASAEINRAFITRELGLSL